MVSPNPMTSIRAKTLEVCTKIRAGPTGMFRSLKSDIKKIRASPKLNRAYKAIFCACHMGKVQEVFSEVQTPPHADGWNGRLHPASKYCKDAMLRILNRGKTLVPSVWDRNLVPKSQQNCNSSEGPLRCAGEDGEEGTRGELDEEIGGKSDREVCINPISSANRGVLANGGGEQGMHLASSTEGSEIGRRNGPLHHLSKGLTQFFSGLFRRGKVTSAGGTLVSSAKGECSGLAKTEAIGTQSCATKALTIIGNGREAVEKTLPFMKAIVKQAGKHVMDRKSKAVLDVKLGISKQIKNPMRKKAVTKIRCLTQLTKKQVRNITTAAQNHHAQDERLRSVSQALKRKALQLYLRGGVAIGALGAGGLALVELDEGRNGGEMAKHEGGSGSIRENADMARVEDVDMKTDKICGSDNMLMPSGHSTNARGDTDPSAYVSMKLVDADKAHPLNRVKIIKMGKVTSPEELKRQDDARGYRMRLKKLGSIVGNHIHLRNSPGRYEGRISKKRLSNRGSFTVGSELEWYRKKMLNDHSPLKDPIQAIRDEVLRAVENENFKAPRGLYIERPATLPLFEQKVMKTLQKIRKAQGKNGKPKTPLARKQKLGRL